jgi:hypothetical protein
MLVLTELWKLDSMFHVTKLVDFYSTANSTRILNLQSKLLLESSRANGLETTREIVCLLRLDNRAISVPNRIGPFSLGRHYSTENAKLRFI